MGDALKIPFTLANLDEAPPPLRLFYSKSDGGYVLNVGGHPDSERLAEFRDNNRELNRQLKAFEGIDPVAARAALADVQGAANTSAKVAELEGALTREREAHAQTRFRQEVSGAFLAMGGRPEAVEFIVQRAGTVFSIDKSGRVTTREYSNVDPSGKLTVVEWLTGQLGSAAFAFQPSRGGGAQASSAPSGRTPKVISSDPTEFGRNLEGIARGKVIVR